MKTCDNSSNEILKFDRSAKEEAFNNLYVQDCRNCQESILHLTQAVWPIIEPGRDFVNNWHIGAVCNHLEAVYRGEITRLIINVPPGASKSTIVSVVFPVWVWIKNATRRLLTGAHNERLAIRDAVKSRRIMESPWFQEWFGDNIKFSSDQNQKTKYENTRGGYRQTFSMSAGITGEKGDIIIIDDPHDAKTAMYSQTERENALNVFDFGVSTRLIESSSAAIIIIMQRIHQNDLSGYLLKTGDWEHLMLPMEFESSRKCTTSIGFSDPRTKQDELLWPEYFTPDRVAQLKKTLRPIGVAGQFQQRPMPATGGIIELQWFKRYNVEPAKYLWQEIVQSWDTAQKENEILNAPSVCGTWVRTETGLYLIHVWRGWLSQPKLERKTVDLYNRFTPHRVIIEDKSSGQGLIQYLKECTNIPVMAFEPCGDKVTRLSVESGAIESGNIWLPENASWVDCYLDELGSFPMSEFKDQADMTSQVLCYFRTHGAIKADAVSYGEDRVTSREEW